MIVGEMMFPLSLDSKTEVMNEQTLLRILNEEVLFDVDVNPKQQDRLSLHFICRQEMLIHGFRYYRGKWVPEEWCPFVWPEPYKEEVTGKLEGLLGGWLLENSIGFYAGKHNCQKKYFFENRRD